MITLLFFFLVTLSGEASKLWFCISILFYWVCLYLLRVILVDQFLPIRRSIVCFAGYAIECISESRVLCEFAFFNCNYCISHDVPLVCIFLMNLL